MSRLENFHDLLKYAPITSLFLGMFSGAYVADRTISAVKPHLVEDAYDETSTGVDNIMAEALLSLAVFLLPPTLVLLTSPITTTAMNNPDVLNLSLAGYITGFELGIGMRGLKGMVDVAIHVVNNSRKKQ
ncbi:hypothetical protein KBD69_03000 [Candidatus Woesebacteria bacterium]|nr:hypothetical protein [Candidatus Woesebacteria bacterium]